MISDDLRNIYVSFIENKYSKNKSKMFLMSESYFEDFCEKYENSEKFRDEVFNHTRSCKLKKLKESCKKETF
jgi:hypothetical protein